jgi:K+-sensing histidine kinase KdpD
VPAVVVVSMLWSVELSIATSVLSALVLGYVQDWPAAEFLPLENGVAIAIFVVAGLSTNILASLARAGAAGADQHRREANRLAERQAALRRVATLVARGVSPPDVFAAVAKEMAHCLNVTDANVCRYETDGGATIVGSYREPQSDGLAVGEHIALDGDSVTSKISAPATPRGWMPTMVCLPAWAVRSLWTNDFGEWSPSALPGVSRLGPIPNSASPNSPTW